MSSTDAYKEWLVLGDTASAVVDTIEVAHPSWPAPVYLTNWAVDVLCTIEDDGEPFTQLFQRAAFIYEPSTVSDGTNQSTTVSIASYNGVIYDFLKSMTPDDREDPIIVRPRQYFDTDLTKQLINPSPKWTLHSVNATFEVLTGDLQIAPLRAHRTGRYYTAREFPALAYAR